MDSFSDRLMEAVHQHGPACVGLDPILEYIPERFQRGNDFDLAAKAEVLRDFCNDVIDKISGRIGIVKLQSAYFELYGSFGMAVMEDIAERLFNLDIVTIFDGKRGDIGATSKAYAEAYLKHQTYDAMTVAPYMGSDSLEPFMKVAKAENRGLFVLCRTSNPGASDLQELWVRRDLASSDETYEPLYSSVGLLVESMIPDIFGAGRSGYADVGLVVGATKDTQMKVLRRAFPSAWFLVPGFGAQGGALDTVKAAFNTDGTGAIINNSRAILYPERFGASPSRTINDAVRTFKDELETCRGGR